MEVFQKSGMERRTRHDTTRQDGTGGREAWSGVQWSGIGREREAGRLMWRGEIGVDESDTCGVG